MIHSKFLRSLDNELGSVTHEHKLIKAFTVEFPKDNVGTLDAHPAVEEVEADRVVTIQS
jgi:Peptidase inhibitor I9